MILYSNLGILLKLFVVVDSFTSMDAVCKNIINYEWVAIILKKDMFPDAVS